MPRLSNSRLQLERPGAQVVPGMEKEVATNFPGPSLLPLPTSRTGGGGWRRKAEMDRERMLSLLAIRPGNVSTTPAYSTGHLSASPAPGCTERLSLSPYASFGLFDSSFSSKRGHIDDPKEFVQPGSVRQVC